MPGGHAQKQSRGNNDMDSDWDCQDENVSHHILYEFSRLSLGKTFAFWG